VLALGSAVALATAYRDRDDALRNHAALVAQQKVAAQQPLADLRPRAVRQADQLPQFVSHEFTEQFLRTAAEVDVPLHEASYNLEASEKKPYLRYRATTTVKTRYFDMRRFIAALASEMPHVSLDSISCNRESTSGVLTCELAFSAFFAKEQ